MSQFRVLWRKEMLELWRSYRWLWLPLVFVVLGAMQPIASRYMPELIDSLGGLPEGAVIEIPLPLPGPAIAEALSQLGTLGLLVLVFAAMHAVVGERSGGQAAFVLVKPVSHRAYLGAKWAAYQTLMLASVLVGLLAAWYYTRLLIGPVPLIAVLGAALVFAAWLGFVLTLLMVLGLLLRSAVGVACATLAIAIALSVIAPLTGANAAWNPATLPGHAMAILRGQAPSVWLPLGTTLAAIAVLFAAAVALLSRRPLMPD